SHRLIIRLTIRHSSFVSSTWTSSIANLIREVLRSGSARSPHAAQMQPALISSEWEHPPLSSDRRSSRRLVVLSFVSIKPRLTDNQRIWNSYVIAARSRWLLISSRASRRLRIYLSHDQSSRALTRALSQQRNMLTPLTPTREIL